MTNTMTISSVKGAIITLVSNIGVNAKVEIAGKAPMEFRAVTLEGDMVNFGPVKAQIKAEDLDAIKAFFAADANAKKEWQAVRAAEASEEKAAFMASAAGKSWLLTKKMEGKTSGH